MSVFILVFVIVLLLWLLRRKMKSVKDNPFSVLQAKPPGPLVLERERRQRCIKNPFSKSAVPEQLDAIVVGSGIGGLSCAALLAKAGQRVLVLEKIGKAGGCCHTFGKKMFEFDVGLHYVGQMNEKCQLRMFIDQITNGNLHWFPINKNFDTVSLGYSNDALKIPFISSEKSDTDMKDSLLRRFPNEKVAIEKFFKAVYVASRGTQMFGMLKLLPFWLCRLVVRSRLLRFHPFFKYSCRTVLEVVSELTDNMDLCSALMYAWGDYGTLPSEAPFALHAVVLSHYLKGAYYPRGGASEIVFNIIPVIEAAGGKVLMKAKVVEILIDDADAACGVRVQEKSGALVEIHAPVVISDAGVANTFTKLLPLPIAQSSRYYRCLQSCNNNSTTLAGLTLFVGLNGTSEELQLPATNFWASRSNDIQPDLDNYLRLDLEDALEEIPPVLFISFPSAKDSTYIERCPGRANATIVAFGRWDWFERWRKDDGVGDRGADYERVKNILKERIWHATLRLFPQLENRDSYSDLGTPVTFNWYISASEGELYGLQHSVKRFSPEIAVDLRPETDIKGLYLTGQDVMTCGFGGAAYGGLLCASAVLGRNLLFDLFRLRQQQKSR